jgi:hypothetical protein
MAGCEGRNWRRYLIEFGGAMVLYTASVPAAIVLANRYEPQGTAALAVAMIPVVPTLLALWAFLRQFWRMDELQRRVTSEAMVVAALVVGLSSFALGWILAVTEADVPGDAATLLWIMPALIGIWGVAMFFVKRRYR